MKIFIDSANIVEIKSATDLGMCDGVTTNPTLVSQSGVDFKNLVEEIIEIVSGPISLEVISTDAVGMIKEAEILAKMASNVVIKLPLIPEGLKACRILTAKGIKTNVTLCFSVSQALLAAKAGATYVSPFIGRLEDHGEDGVQLLHDIRTLYDNHGFDTKILAASIRTVKHFSDSALAGSDVATIPYKILLKLFHHSLTDKGLAQFLDDWKNSGKCTIL